jgi:allantoate deiminase
MRTISAVAVTANPICVPPQPIHNHARRATDERLAAFARHGDVPDKLTRLYLSPAHKAAVEELTSWMRQAGLSVSVDTLGTIIGRHEGKKIALDAFLALRKKPRRGVSRED